MPQQRPEPLLLRSAAEQRCAGRDADDDRGETVLAPGVMALQVIGPQGVFDWDHGFALARLSFATGAVWRAGTLNVPHVLFVQRGSVRVRVDDAEATLGAGDTLTVPVGADRAIAADAAALVVSVTGEAA